MTQTDIDRIFIATNFEEDDLEENDDSSLCRFEFSEIIVRMARCKYHDKGKCKTIWESVEKLLLDHIIPNTIEAMEWQPFRDKYLWTLEVDDLLKANRAGIEKLYKVFSTNGTGKSRFFSKDDGIKMVGKANVPLADERNVIAYALSKHTLENEMDDFHKYNQMLLTEFYEYIGRLAQLLYPENIPLASKIEKLLQYLLPQVGFDVKRPEEDLNIESESDYDDDWVDEINQNIMREKFLVHSSTAILDSNEASDVVSYDG